MKNKIIIAVILILIALVVFASVRNAKKPSEPVTALSFEDCVQAGYPVMERYPRQCKTPDGRTYAEEIPVSATYTNASTTDIVVDLPTPGAVTGKTFTVMGRARGPWYFEASFPVKILDGEGNIIAQTPAQAQGSWMTNDFVAFKAEITVPSTFTGPARVVLKNDNPSGDPSRDKSVSFPITIEY